ncbi:hypothetical protein PCH_Pc21g20500 [Penicillium rubens Wisconsin 54-1255]|uniref:Uncharacterized protein n=1 Tax=Penicillium rubens (strain ATCC 28089 / DSM 1075 / NRRL 1951 / Wisconsin 54-1255) TaxID=500485 RepID=B6HKP2_PENRW|nr:hypothetical protein PCH_Pc21g20500 [Penicillium rubens Wisconsin 54-1255]
MEMLYLERSILTGKGLTSIGYIVATHLEDHRYIDKVTFSYGQDAINFSVIGPLLTLESYNLPSSFNDAFIPSSDIPPNQFVGSRIFGIIHAKARTSVALSLVTKVTKPSSEMPIVHSD